MSVKMKEHFYPDFTVYRNNYAPILQVERYSPIHVPFLAASFSCMFLLCEYSLKIARREQRYVSLDLSFCWGPSFSSIPLELSFIYSRAIPGRVNIGTTRLGIVKV